MCVSYKQEVHTFDTGLCGSLFMTCNELHDCVRRLTADITSTALSVFGNIGLFWIIILPPQKLLLLFPVTELTEDDNDDDGDGGG